MFEKKAINDKKSIYCGRVVSFIVAFVFFFLISDSFKVNAEYINLCNIPAFNCQSVDLRSHPDNVYRTTTQRSLMGHLEGNSEFSCEEPFDPYCYDSTRGRVGVTYHFTNKTVETHGGSGRSGYNERNNNNPIDVSAYFPDEPITEFVTRLDDANQSVKTDRVIIEFVNINDPSDVIGQFYGLGTKDLKTFTFFQVLVNYDNSVGTVNFPASHTTNPDPNDPRPQVFRDYAFSSVGTSEVIRYSINANPSYKLHRVWILFHPGISETQAVYDFPSDIEIIVSEPPSCNITGPNSVAVNSTAVFNSNFSDPEGDSASNCSWSTTLGSFAGNGCATETFTAPNVSGSVTLTYTATDSQNLRATCQKTVTITNATPSCTISGPTNMLVGKTQRFTSSYNDPEGVGPFNCNWTSSAGTFYVGWIPMFGCTWGNFASPLAPSRPVITYTANDGENTCSDTHTVNVYGCTVSTPSSYDQLVGDTYWFDSGDAGFNVTHLMQGPSGLVPLAGSPSFNFSNTSTCGGLAAPTSNPTPVSMLSVASGTTCTLTSQAALSSAPNISTVCPDVKYHKNVVPTCSNLRITGSNPVNICSDTTSFAVTSSDNDSGPSTLSHTWSVTCASGGTGTFTTPNGTAAKTISWSPPGANTINPNGETCNIRVAVSDGIESTSCTLDGALSLNYTHNISFDLDHYDLEPEQVENSCGTNPQPATGARVTLYKSDGSYTGMIRDGETVDPNLLDPDSSANGYMEFQNIPSPADNGEYNYRVVYTPECTSSLISCQTVNGTTTNVGRISENVFTITPNQCGTTPISVGLYEQESDRWMTSIDGDYYSSNVSMTPVCGDEDRDGEVELGGSFNASLLNFIGVSDSNEWRDAYAHIVDGVISDYEYVCPTETDIDDHCGAAVQINNYSGYFRDLKIFEIPSYIKGDAAYQLSTFPPVGSPLRDGEVYWMTAEDFNNMFDGTATPIDIFMNQEGACVIYVEDGAALDISNPINVVHPGAGAAWKKDRRVILITNNDVSIAENVGYGSPGSPLFGAAAGDAGYTITAAPNVDMAIMTSGTITIEGQGTSEGGESDDIPVMLRGPFVAEQIILDRDLWVNNDMYPTASVMYNTSVLSRLTEAQRLMCDEDLFGIGLFDVQFTYE